MIMEVMLQKEKTNTKKKRETYKELETNDVGKKA